MQRGIHYQDDLGDVQSAIADYETALTFNSLQNGTCQVVTAATLVNGALPSSLSPAPCIFTLRLRLGFLVEQSNPTQAIQLFQEVTKIDPLKLGVNTMIAETYVIEAQQSTDPTTQQQDYASAIQAYQAELALSPVTPATIALTGDLANNAHVHWALAQIYQTLGQLTNEASELKLYLQATQWHSDVYPWRITVATNLLKTLP
jgi:tetratricopeptide (TPR) repeat protein